jgi:Fic family protein
MNCQLLRLGYPMVIIRNKNKQTYYRSFYDYQENKKSDTMERVVMMALLESLHRRIAYLNGDKIIKVSEYAKSHNAYLPSLLNSALRQTIPAFREKGVWKLSSNYISSD